MESRLLYLAVISLVVWSSGTAHAAARHPGPNYENNVPEQLLDTVRKQADEIKLLSRENEELKKLFSGLSQSSAKASEYGPRDCAEILSEDPSASSGPHQVFLWEWSNDPTLVYCDMETAGGGWTVIQRRGEGLLSFVQNYQTYADGFGLPLTGLDFWMGNHNLHALTSRWTYELRIDMENAEGETRHITYPHFMVGSEATGFMLQMSGAGSGDIADSMYNNRGMRFSTFDHDADNSPLNCAVIHNGAWWYNNCTDANLNGEFINPGLTSQAAIFWYDWEQHRSLARVKMMVRPVQHGPGEPCPPIGPAPTCEPCPTPPPIFPSDCSGIQEGNPTAESGEYDITLELPGGNRQVRVYCDMETDGGGWTVFQRRMDGSIDFFKNYQSYKEGFGSVSAEFWLGNENLHFLTLPGDYEMRVDMRDFHGIHKYQRYGHFAIAHESDGFRINFSDWSGTAGHAMDLNNNQRFTTYDMDQDGWGGNCADRNHGAWWYGICTNANLNGRYADTAGIEYNFWWNFHRNFHGLQFTEMKTRPRREEQ